jgi:hypothetical protein
MILWIHKLNYNYCHRQVAAIRKYIKKQKVTKPDTLPVFLMGVSIVCGDAIEK